MDLNNRERGKSFFQLARRLLRIRSGNPQNLLPLAEEDSFNTDEKQDDEEEDCDSKSPAGNVKTRAMWGRKQSHNEQLIVRPCGVIVAHQTFYGSEGVVEAKVWL